MNNRKKIKVLELFSGTASISRAFTIRGHECITVDNQKKLRPTFVHDITKVDTYCYDWIKPDVVWASPPCTTFSVASIGKHWTGGYRAYKPKTKEAEVGIEIVKKTLQIINHIEPMFWFIENPRGLLRKMDFMQTLHRKTLTYCQYGDGRMKPTDIWTNAEDWTPKPMCKNGDPCHIPAPRGSRTGTQGLDNDVERGRIPQQLCDEIVRYCENKKK